MLDVHCDPSQSLILGSRFERCRGQITTASSLLPKLKDERRRVLADPDFAHGKLCEMVRAGAIDPDDAIEALRSDEAGRLLVRKVIDPRITIYKHSLLDGLQKLKARDVLVKGIASPQAWAAGWLVRNPRARESRSRPVRSCGSRRLSRTAASSDDDGLSDPHLRCPRCGGADYSFASRWWWCDRCEYEGWRQEVEDQLARVLAEADRITRGAA